MKMIEWKKKSMKWIENQTLYISIPFTWELPKIRKELMQRSFFYDRVIVGGPALFFFPDYFSDLKFVIRKKHMPGMLQKVNHKATRTSRGCIRNCKFCGVKKIYKNFIEFKDWPDKPIVCDDNLLACSNTHFDKVIDRLKKHEWSDFNQGLDCRLLTSYHAKRLSELKNPMIRLALDSMDYAHNWEYAFNELRSAGIAKKNIRSYALIGFKSDPDEAWHRCEWIEKHKIKVLPMWYHPIDSLKYNQITDEQKKYKWNDLERRKIMQWFYKHKKAVEYDTSISRTKKRKDSEIYL